MSEHEKTQGSWRETDYVMPWWLVWPIRLWLLAMVTAIIIAIVGLPSSKPVPAPVKLTAAQTNYRQGVREGHRWLPYAVYGPWGQIGNSYRHPNWLWCHVAHHYGTVVANNGSSALAGIKPAPGFPKPAPYVRTPENHAWMTGCVNAIDHIRATHTFW